MMKLNTSHALLKESIESYQEKVNELHKVILKELVPVTTLWDGSIGLKHMIRLNSNAS